MVVSALCERYLPSHRGLLRNQESLAAANDSLLWQKHHYHNNLDNKNDNYTENEDSGVYSGNSILGISQPENDGILKMGNNNTPSAAAGIRPKRNRCKASKFLASLAADFDVLTDWLFYAHCYNENNENYRSEGEYKIPPWMVGTVLVTCLIGTTLWLILATDGAIVTPVLRFLGYDKLNLGHVLLACVLLEDLPQIILTFYIEDYFEEDLEFSNYALVNVVASLYDILIKLAEAFDQRADVVETGHWCKESINAHNGKVICLVPIPEDGDDESNAEGDYVDSSIRDSISKNPEHFEAHGGGSKGGASALFRNRLHVSNNGDPLAKDPRRKKRRSLLQEAREMVADTKLPSMRFLSASMDGSVKLWDTSVNNGVSGGRGRKPSDTFIGHGNRVSCISFVRKVGIQENYQKSTKHTQKLYPDNKDSYYFLTGSYDGTSKLWNTSDTRCIETYKTLPFGNEAEATIEVTSIAYIGLSDEDKIETPLAPNVSTLSSAAQTITTTARPEYFVNGYKSGKACLWNLWSGTCLKVFEERIISRNLFSRIYNLRRSSKIYSMCSMEDSRHFATGSKDGILRMWNTGISTTTNGDNEKEAIDTIVERDSTDSDKITDATSSTIRTTMVSNTPPQLFTGHTKTIFSVKCLSSGSILLSGSEDTTARLWSVSTGACLQTFFGHTKPIHDVAIVDQVSFLTASRDGTIMAWDAKSGDAFRTYENSNRNHPVTAVATGDQSGCFLSGDEDGNIGLWIISAVHDQHQQSNLLDFDDGLMVCGGCHGDEGDVAAEVNDAQVYTRI